MGSQCNLTDGKVALVPVEIVRRERCLLRTMGVRFLWK